jgi:hypothetical protein
MSVTRSRSRCVKKRVDMEHAWNTQQPRSLASNQASARVPASQSPPNDHIYPILAIPIIPKRSCHCHCCHPVQSSPHTRLSQACLVGTKIQYLQASKQRLAHHHRRTGSVGCKVVAVVPCRVTNKFMLSNRGLLGEQCRRARMHDLSRGPKWWAALTDPVAERGGEGHEQRRDHVTSDVRPNDSVREFRNA